MKEFRALPIRELLYYLDQNVKANFAFPDKKAIDQLTDEEIEKMVLDFQQLRKAKVIK